MKAYILFFMALFFFSCESNNAAKQKLTKLRFCIDNKALSVKELPYFKSTEYIDIIYLDMNFVSDDVKQFNSIFRHEIENKMPIDVFIENNQIFHGVLGNDKASARMRFTLKNNDLNKQLIVKLSKLSHNPLFSKINEMHEASNIEDTMNSIFK